MNENIYIIYPKKHIYTFILLHPMTCNYNFFNEFLKIFENKKKTYFNNVKFIIPNAEIMNIDYPNNKLYNISSWYNYYTCNDGINKLDIIDTNNFFDNTLKIVNIINNEAKILNNYKHIYVYGVSQGGTLAFNILKMLPKNIGGLFISKSIYMKKYINLNSNKKTPIFIYSGKNDQIYKLNFQKKLIKYLKHNGYEINWLIENNIDHFTNSINEYSFIINNFISTNLK